MDFKDEFDFISEKAKQLTDTGIRKADEVIGISKLKLRCIKIDALIKAKYTELGRTTLPAAASLIFCAKVR